MKIAAFALCLLSAPVGSATLVIHQPWASDTYRCTELRAKGGPNSGHAEGVCYEVQHSQDADHLFESGFDETPWGGWSYRVTLGAAVIEQGGCALSFFSPTQVLLICH